MKFEKSDAYRKESHRFIPGGAHTYSKGGDQFPELSPAAIVRGKGGRVWDLDGNEFVDCSMALGSVSLGHAYEPVIQAVREQLEKGANFQRPAALELELAKAFVAAVKGAERIKFAKNGSTVTSAAVKLARAFNGRALVAFPGNHPFYSYDDWFIGKTYCYSGVPDGIKSLSVTYDSRDPDTLEKLFQKYPGQISCVITEPEDVIPNPPEVIREVARITRKHGALFIADEMVTGYRAGWPGLCSKLDIQPDMATWGKATGNGFSFCALTGRADVMDLGGIRQTKSPRVFLISTTHGGETTGLAAALAVIRTYQQEDVVGYHHRLVTQISEGIKKARAKHELDNSIDLHASPWRVVTLYKDEKGNISSPFRTLFLQEMIKRGVLFQGLFLPCFTHTEKDVAQFIQAYDESCAVYREALKTGAEKFLVGQAAQPVFRKYNRCVQVCPSNPCPLEDKCHD